MVHTVKPFKATRYNKKRFKDFSSVVCPPYDVISKKQLASLRKKSVYNFSNILIADNGNYERSAKRFNEWLKKDIFIDDDSESLYLYEQKFKVEGKNVVRYGILSLMRMDSKNRISPHEHTLKAPKKDRRKIIEKVRANLSPIFVIAPKRLDVLARAYKNHKGKKAFMKFRDLDGNVNSVWKIDNPSDIKKICKEIDRQRLVIADGHHRFEVSYGYYQKNKSRFKDLNFILTYITDTQKGLLILPTHRIAKIKLDKKSAIDRLKKYFNVKKVKEASLDNKLQKDKGIFSFGMYLGGGLYFLKLKRQALLDKVIDNPAYKKIDSYVLHKFIFPLLNVRGDFAYTHTIKEAKKMTKKGECAFLLRGLPLKTLFDMSYKGWRLPQKSTYFYPKVYSGIAIRRFVS